jgi:hypothetical protein
MASQPSGQSAARERREELDRVLADARKNALDYADALPNLICRQTTQQFYDQTGKGDWRIEDQYFELLPQPLKKTGPWFPQKPPEKCRKG